MKKCKEDLTNRIFGRWKVLYQAEDYVSPQGYSYRRWHCVCTCGSGIEKDLVESCLTGGKTKSCGCYKREVTIAKDKARKKTNKYDLESYDYGVGWTEKGERFLFDKSDYELIVKHCWYTFTDDDGLTYLRDRNGVIMHRLIMNVSKYDKRVVDHIGHDTLDNRKINLRVGTNSENQMNRGLQQNNTSGVAGVSKHGLTGKWQAYIGIDNKTKYLGLYEDFEEAVAVRKAAEKRYFGDKAYDISMQYAEQYKIDERH